MKINITIDIEPSEVAALLRLGWKRYEPTPEPTPEPEQFARVEDNELNRASSYWQPRIGEIVKVVQMGPGNSWTVQTETDPIPLHNIDGTRFTIVLHR